jgi:hypothetical protein
VVKFVAKYSPITANQSDKIHAPPVISGSVAVPHDRNIASSVISGNVTAVSAKIHALPVISGNVSVSTPIIENIPAPTPDEGRKLVDLIIR